MPRTKSLSDIGIFNVLRAFKMGYAQVYDMEARGVLPARENSKVSPEWIEALAAWHERVRGELPPEAAELLTQIRD